LIVDQLRMAGDNATALLLLDREMGARKEEAGTAVGAGDAT
jgi:ferritin